MRGDGSRISERISEVKIKNGRGNKNRTIETLESAVSAVGGKNCLRSVEIRKTTENLQNRNINTCAPHIYNNLRESSSETFLFLFLSVSSPRDATGGDGHFPLV